MAVILSLETSSKYCSVAIHNNENLLAEAEVHQNQAHGSKLAVLIEEVKRSSNIDWKDLQAVAVSSGPGSYTGLRIGAATAKGLCYSLKIPLISIGTLDLMAYQMSRSVENNKLLCPMLDARRMEVYCKIVKTDLSEIEPTKAVVVEEDTFNELLIENHIVFFGDGALKCKDVILSSNAFFADNIYPIASYMGSLALKKFELSQIENLVEFEPLYLKEFLVKKSTKNIL